ncbi:MAG: hypothetical protein WC724_01615 [Candidatus Paceibacterota bacterium]|jgi:hypothetical protein
MDKNALARNNHLFFYVFLTQHALLTETFLDLCDIGAREVSHWESFPDDAPIGNGIQQLAFHCRGDELGYLRFTNDTAKIIAEKEIRGLQMALKIPSFIRGELNDSCEFTLNNGVQVSFKITGYEGDPDDGRGFVEIIDPVSECSSDDIPLGRMVEMSVICTA